MRRILYILALIIFVLCMDKINAYTEYKIGDVVSYNDIDFYVLKDSSSKEDSVTMLKAEPLSYEEVRQYSTGTGAQISNQHGYGGVQYHSSNNDYSTSYIKTIVDSWTNDKLPSGLVESRLILKDEIETERKEYDPCNGCGASLAMADIAIYPWFYNNDYWYWTSIPGLSSTYNVLIMKEQGFLYNYYVESSSGTVRPVITLKKTVLGDEDESIIDDNEIVDNKTDVKDPNETEIDTKDNTVDNKTNESKATVKVDNTYLSSSILLIILGFITASISVFVLYKFRNKSKNN